jgi:hypothetical protein
VQMAGEDGFCGDAIDSLIAIFTLR